MEQDLSFAFLAKEARTYKEWLIYYKNIWTRNLIARTIDVDTDKALKAKDPEESVVNPTNGMPYTVKERLEDRKIIVQDALDLLTGIDRLLKDAEDTSVNFAQKYWSEDALKVDADMVEKLSKETIEPKVGDACTTADGKDGVLAEMDGKLVCVEKEPEAAPVTDGANPSEEARV